MVLQAGEAEGASISVLPEGGAQQGGQHLALSHLGGGDAAASGGG